MTKHSTNRRMKNGIGNGALAASRWQQLRAERDDLPSTLSLFQVGDVVPHQALERDATRVPILRLTPPTS